MNFDKPEHTAKLANGASFEARFAQSQEIPGIVLRAGADYVKKGKVKYQSIHSQASGTTELIGTVQCGFGIVHHPSVMTVHRGDRLLAVRHHCGCREGAREHFCAHCAALVAACFGTLEARLEVEAQNADTDTRGIRIRLGTQKKTGEPIYWTPEDAERVATPNLVVLGGQDTGNTQVMKSIALQFLRQRERQSGETGVLILDWMGDYNESKTDFMEASGARVRRLQKLPLDPFSLRKLERKPQLHVHRAMAFADTLARAYGLGPLQKSTLVQSVVATYAAKGITSDPVTWDLPAPTFAEVYEEYCSRPQSQRSEDLTQVMDALATFELFDSAPPERTTAVEMFRGVVIIDMSGYPRELQSFAAGIMLEQFHAQLCGARRSRSGRVRKLLMIDEVDDLLAMGSPGLEGILQRSREYGLAVVLAARSAAPFCTEDYDWWKVIRAWVIHNTADLLKLDLEKLLGLDSFEMGLERLYQWVKHQQKLESLIRIGAEEPLMGEDLPFFDIVGDRRESYLVEKHAEVKPLPLEGMPLLDAAHLDVVDIQDDIPAAPMAELKDL